MIIALFTLYILLSTTGMLLIKTGSSGTSFNISGGIFNVSINYILLIGMMLYIFSFILFIILVTKSNLSYIYPVSAGIINIVTFCLGVFVLKERYNMISIAGLICIVVGVMLMSIKA